MKIAAIVEGDGDAQAIPALISKTGDLLGMQIFAPNPIKVGCFTRLSQPGKLEKFVKLAASRDGIDLILIVVDLDDGCAAQAKADFDDRCKAIAAEIGKPVEVAFCVREYECLFLANLVDLRKSSPEYGWAQDFECPDPESKRDAKRILNSSMTKHYKEIIDQLKLTQRLNLKSLYQSSRTYRRFVRAITQMEYEVLGIAF